MSLSLFGATSFPEAYDLYLVPSLFRPWAELLLDLAPPAPGARVLDLACGTGVVGRRARERMGGGGRVVGVDLSPAMIGMARIAAPELDWREGSADALPLLEGERFDVLYCQQGLQFFPDRPGALREMRRALAPGGRVALATWRSDEESPFLRELRRVAERTVGPIVDPRHSLPVGDEVRSLLSDAGFEDVEVTRHVLTIEFPDGNIFVTLNAMALAGMSAAGRSMSEVEREEAVSTIVRESGDVAARNSSKGGALSYEIGSNVAVARNPR
jgi:ubiquinone/menaquinone biosynthesis C-methylase UbiE